MSLSRKRKKELRQLQDQANSLWETQQMLVTEAAGVAREAGRQLGNFHREQVIPGVHDRYQRHVAPRLDRGVKYSSQVLNDRVVPVVGGVVGSAMSVWDAATDTRARLAAGRTFELPDREKYAKLADAYAKAASKKMSTKLAPPAPQPSGIGAGGIIALILGAAAALGVAYAAWQTLRADDELWVADDPLRAPDL